MKQQELEKENKSYSRYNFIISIALFAMLILSCKDNNTVSQKVVVQNQDTALFLSDKNAYILYTEQGKKKFSLRSGILNLYSKTENESEYKESLNGFEVIFYEKNGQDTTSFIRGQRARTFNKDTKLEINYNVVVSNFKTKETLYTEQILWDKEKELIWTDKRIKIVSEDGVIFGEGIRANQNFEKGYTIIKPTGDFEVDENSLNEEQKEEEEPINSEE